MIQEVAAVQTKIGTGHGIILGDVGAASSQINIAGNGILTAGEQGIYVNCPLETVATNGIWITLKSDVITGDCTGVRSRVTGNAASGGANIRGTYSEAFGGASKHVGLLTGVMAHASVAAAGVNVDEVCALRAHVSTGATLTNNTLLCAAHLRVQTRGDETISGEDEVLLLENEAVVSTGRQMNSFIKTKPSTMGGGVKSAAYLIDGGIDTDLLATAVLRLPDDGSVCNDTDTGAASAVNGDDFDGYITVVVGTATRYIPLLTNKPSAEWT
jgi:hypothetical protein